MPSTQTAERTRIQLCGSLSIEIDGQARAAALRGRQVPLLLAYLVLNRERVIGRDELIGAMWPEAVPKSQDGSLRTLLSRLRSVLGSEVVVGRDEIELRLPEPSWVDVEAATLELGRAQTALERGDARAAWALAQVPLNIAARGLLPGVQADWLEERRRDLQDLHLRALELIGQAGLRLGSRAQLPSVRRAARNLITAEPYRESGYVLLMQAHATEGNIAEGLRVFEELRTLLRDELGMPPSAEALAAHEGLLRTGTPAMSDGAAGIGPDARPELSAELRARAAEPLIARDQELEGLTRSWEQATRGEAVPDARLLLLTGDAGIGKTRLIAELAVRVHEAGAAVLAGRCPSDALLPYQPFVEALRPYLEQASIESLSGAAREYGTELARLLPELRRQVPDLPQPARGEADTERYRLFEAVVGLLSTIATRSPVLLVIDDLQWADRPTLLLLRHVVRARSLGRVLVLGAVRGTEAAGLELADVIGEVRRDGLARSVAVRGLSAVGVADLVRERTSEAPSLPLARALHARTEGNPFFVGELIRQLTEAGVDIARAGGGVFAELGLPPGIKEVIAQRLRRLDTAAISWLRVAAVIGRDFDPGLLETVLGADEEAFLAGTDAAFDAGLVAEAGGAQLSFTHALIHEAVYEEMSLPRRARLHRRVGAALEAQPGEPPLAALAYHFTRAAGAQDAGQAIEYARAAGEQATAMLAHEEAAEHFARALEVQERFAPGDRPLRLDLLLSLGEARIRAGERPATRPTFREAAVIAGELDDVDALARTAIAASRRYIQAPGVVDADLIALLEQALERTQGQRTTTRIALLTRLCGALYYAGQPERMARLSTEATEIATEIGGAEARALAAAARRRARWDAAHLPARIADATELLTAAEAAGDLELSLQGHAWLVLDLLEQGDAAGVEAQIAAFSAGADRLRQPLYLWNAGVWRAMQALLAGRLEEAERLAREALAIGAAGETVTAPQYYAVQLLAIRREQGRMAELEPAARQLVAANPDRFAWRSALIALLCETGRNAEARQELAQLAAGDFSMIPRDGDWMTTMALLADSAADLGETTAAEQLYRLLTPYVESNVVIGLAAVCLGSAARLLGRLASTLGERDAAAVHFEQALVADAAVGAAVSLAHGRIDYARLLGSGDPRVTDLLDAAVRAGEQLGLDRVLRRARATPSVG